jgi:hypothetical protein
MMVEEDEDESPHVNADETDEEAQDTCSAFDDNFTIEEDDHCGYQSFGISKIS